MFALPIYTFGLGRTLESYTYMYIMEPVYRGHSRGRKSVAACNREVAVTNRTYMYVGMYTCT